MPSRVAHFPEGSLSGYAGTDFEAATRTYPGIITSPRKKAKRFPVLWSDDCRGLRCRAGLTDPGKFGLSQLDEAGYWWIAANLLRDVAGARHRLQRGVATRRRGVTRGSRSAGEPLHG